jgi:hypothetical protein
VATGFRVPHNINRPVVRLAFWVWDSGDPVFSVEAAPWQASDRLEERDRQLLVAARKLDQAGFQGGYHYGEQVWWTEHKLDAFIGPGDVTSRLIGLIDKDVTAIVDSGALAYDLKAAARGGRGGPPKVGTKRKRS